MWARHKSLEGLSSKDRSIPWDSSFRKAGDTEDRTKSDPGEIGRT